MNLRNKNSWAQVTGFLKTSEANVWRLLTEPQLTERYMYNCQLHADWHIGGQAVWRAPDENGKWIDHVRAQVLVYSPYQHLAFNVVHQATAKRPEVTSELHYILKPKAEGVHLTIKQGDFVKLNLDEELFESCQQGWKYVMPLLIETSQHVFEQPG
jgi:uncharacterized protein YndB with AHSA1/START domain